MKVAIIGTGIYGVALAHEIVKNSANNVWMWTENVEFVTEYQKNKQIKAIYNQKWANNIHVTNSYENALKDAKIIILACASKFIDIVCQNIKPYYNHKMVICIATKGIEETTEELLSNVVANTLLTRNIAVISGPTFALDMLHGDPVALAIASKNKKIERLIIKILANDRLKLRPTKDIIGVQLCGAIKNCLAIASGILYGLGYTESTQAFLINEAVHDMKQIIYYLGGKPKTILSFAGIGDIMLTCTSQKSRNFSFGYVIGHTKDSEKIKKYLNNNTVEGYYTLDVVYKLLKHKMIDIPLINIIYDIVYNDADPESLAKFLIEKK